MAVPESAAAALDESRWLECGTEPAVACALAALQAAGATGLKRVQSLHAPALPPRTSPRASFLDREHVEAVVGAEMARCCPWRLLCAHPRDYLEDVYAAHVEEGGRARTIFAGLRAAPDGTTDEGWLPIVAHAPSSFFARAVVCGRLSLCLPACIFSLMAFFSLLLVGNYVRALEGVENSAGIRNPAMCLHEFETTDDDVVIGSNGLPAWVDPSLMCYANNVSVHKLPVWRENVAALGAAVTAAGGVLKLEAIWPAAVVCSPIIAAATLPSAVIGLMARVTQDVVLWGALCAALFFALLAAVLSLRSYFFARARALWPVTLDTSTFAEEEAADSTVQLVKRSSLLLLTALQQLLAVRRASLHMVSYSWDNQKGKLFARFLGTSLPDCWVDVARLPFTLNLSDQIVTQAQHTRTLLLLVDSNYLRSLNCCKELAAAVAHRHRRQLKMESSSSGRGGEAANLLTAAVLIKDEEEGGMGGRDHTQSVDWDAIQSTLTGLGFHVALGPRTLQEWLVAHSLSVSSPAEAQSMLAWFQEYGGPREADNGPAPPSMATLTMLRRTHCCSAYAMLFINALCFWSCGAASYPSFSCCCCFLSRGRQKQHTPLVAGTRMLSADGCVRSGAWGAGGCQARGIVVCFLGLLLVMAYAAIDMMVGYLDGVQIQSQWGVIPIIMFSYMSLQLLGSFLLLVAGLLTLYFAAPALFAADPRRRYDSLLHPLVVAAQCDDWMRRSHAGTRGNSAAPTAPLRPFFRVLLAVDAADIAAAALKHAELPAIISNLEAFLAKDIGVTVARAASVQEALRTEQQAATITVFFLASGAAIAEWLEGSTPQMRQQHVIAVCPCCAPRDSLIWQCLFVGVCESAGGATGGARAAAAAAATPAPARAGAEAPLLKGGERSSPSSCACEHKASFARDLLQAIVTKVPVVMLANC